MVHSVESLRESLAFRVDTILTFKMNCMLLSTVQHDQRRKIQSDDRKSNDTFGVADCFLEGY